MVPSQTTRLAGGLKAISIYLCSYWPQGHSCSHAELERRMRRRKILTSDELASGKDILSDLDLQIETRKVLAHARWNLLLILITTAISAANFIPDFQAPSLWIGCAIAASWLARRTKRVAQALQSRRLTKASAAQLQLYLDTEAASGQAFAYKHTAFKPDMSLTVVTLNKQNVMRMVTYQVAPETPPSIVAEDRQVYIKAWLFSTFADRWTRLAESRGISIPKQRIVATRFANTNT